MRPLFFLIFITTLLACNHAGQKQNISALFQSVPKSVSGIDFENRLTETEEFNYFKYPYFYMGGGVAAGDFDNDGLTDVFFTGNQVKNALFLNKGGLEFENITARAGVGGSEQWYTGATLCDINADGHLDIYVCVSGKEGDKSNELYVNNGDATFTELARAYGIDDDGGSIQAVFFDYDNDGDIDLYVANYPFTPFSSSLEYYKERVEGPILKDSDRLYENQGNGTYKDVTEKSGVLNFGLSLGAVSADFNQDGYQDIYVSNDFASPDFFYLNNGDGTFRNILEDATAQTSFYGMGIDAADFNNDGMMDIAQLDMNPEDNRRSKENMASMDPSRFEKILDFGFHYQYMHNVLQLNRGNERDGTPYFSNISRLAGVSSTDWSWASLFADFDNDGWKDLYITNGSRKDVNNKDFFKKLRSRLMFKKDKNYLAASYDLPSERLDNYMFRNNGNYTFAKVNTDWNINFSGYSNGAAYADLDNDGDLEIILNNIDSAAVIHKNNSCEISANNFLRFKLFGPSQNPIGLGARIKLEHGNEIQFQELTLTRGFQSSVEPVLHFGIGDLEQVDKVAVEWPDGKEQILQKVSKNQILEIKYEEAVFPNSQYESSTKPIFANLTEKVGIDHIHVENDFDDYQKQVLLPHKYSNLGPALAVADVNGDNLDDFFIGGAKGFSATLYLQLENGTFDRRDEGLWKKERDYEDVDALFFDVDQDGDQDLYVVSGGYEYEEESPLLQDRLYLNNGKGKFSRSEHVLPRMSTSGACVKAGDIDNDGDLDLFVGGHIVPGKYPYPPQSYFLENRSSGKSVSFVDKTQNICPEISNLGLVSDALWTDVNQDGVIDLMVVGEWMSPTIFINSENKLLNASDIYGTQDLKGWWYSIASGDFDKDGRQEYLLGNLGLNYKYQASDEEPFEVYANDFDNNGTVDIVLGYYNNGIQYPVRGKQCSTEQMPRLEFKFQNYKSFASASLLDVYGKEQLSNAQHYQANTFASGYLDITKENNLTFRKLSNLAQFSSINNILIEDFDSDSNLDALIIGNLFASEVETPRNDASIGLLLKGDGHGEFVPILYKDSGFFAPGDAKEIRSLQTKKGRLIIVANNQGPVQVFGL